METVAIAAISALIDWAVTRSEAAGEEIPQDLLDARTAIRKEEVRLANEQD